MDGQGRDIGVPDVVSGKDGTAADVRRSVHDPRRGDRQGQHRGDSKGADEADSTGPVEGRHLAEPKSRQRRVPLLIRNDPVTAPEGGSGFDTARGQGPREITMQVAVETLPAGGEV